jgi:hypothetical protein
MTDFVVLIPSNPPLSVQMQGQTVTPIGQSGGWVTQATFDALVARVAALEAGVTTHVAALSTGALAGASLLSASGSAGAQPLIARTSAAGAAPLTFDWQSGYPLAGQSVLYEITNTTTPTYDANGFFTSTVTQSDVHLVTGEEAAKMDYGLGYYTPSGPYTLHVAILTDDDNGDYTDPATGATYSVGPFSNPISGVITASAATFVPKNGPDKFPGIFLYNNNLSAYVDGNYGTAAVSATLPATSSKFWVECKPDSIYDGTNGVVRCGFYDGSTDLSTLTTLPGSSSTGPNGLTLTTLLGSSSVAYSRNGTGGGANAWALPAGVVWTIGDALHIEPDTGKAQPTVLVKFWDASTSTAYTLGTLTLTSKIPSPWVFFALGAKGHVGSPSTSDGFTANFGATPPLIAPTSGYSFYA